MNRWMDGWMDGWIDKWINWTSLSKKIQRGKNGLILKIIVSNCIKIKFNGGQFYKTYIIFWLFKKVGKVTIKWNDYNKIEVAEEMIAQEICKKNEIRF